MNSRTIVLALVVAAMMPTAFNGSASATDCLPPLALTKTASDCDTSFATPVCAYELGCESTAAFGDKRCNSFQMYEIDATIESGTGEATVEVRCGDSAVECTVSTSGDISCHAKWAEGPGDFECRVIAKTGNVKIVGSCKDPVNPYAVYEFVMGPDEMPLPRL